MYNEIYIDLVFAANLLMDYILLRIVSLWFRCRKSRRRCFFAAMLGSVVSCLILYIPTEAFLPVIILLHGASAMGMLWIGCGLKKGGLLVKAMITLYLAAFLCGGFLEAVTANQPMTLWVFLLAALTAYIGFYAWIFFADSLRSQRRNIYPVTLTYQGKIQSSYGFYDTGNLLVDSVNGRPVSIVKPDILEVILSRELVEKLKHLKEEPGELKSTELTGLRPHLLSYKTVGTQEGMLVAVTLEELCIHTPREAVHISDPVFAFSLEPFTLEKEYKVLLNSRLLH